MVQSSLIEDEAINKMTEEKPKYETAKAETKGEFFLHILYLNTFSSHIGNSNAFSINKLVKSHVAEKKQVTTATQQSPPKSSGLRK